MPTQTHRVRNTFRPALLCSLTAWSRGRDHSPRTPLTDTLTAAVLASDLSATTLLRHCRPARTQR